MLTFHIEGIRYYLYDLVYVYYYGGITEGKKVHFQDGNKLNLKASNLYIS